MNASARRARKVYSRQFWLICMSSFFFFASFNMIIPELPAYLTSLGGAEYKGLIISLFALTALFSRPFSGKMADKLGRVPVMMTGSAVCLVVGILYPLFSTVWGFLLLRLVHGFSTGFTPTGQAAYLSDIIPAERRGEAMGLLGTAGSIGMAAGPAIGGLIANRVSIPVLFYCSSAMSLASLAVLVGVKETLKVRSKFSPAILRVGRKDLFEKRVWLPCVVMGLSIYAYGTMLTLIPDFGSEVGIRNKGLLFTYFTVSSLFVRLLAGRASDRYGRRKVLMVSVTLIIIAMYVISQGATPRDLIIGMSLYGLAHGMTSPTLLAWATDLSDERHKGRGVASLYIFMELGIGVGAFVSGLLLNTAPDDFGSPFLACVALSAMALGFLVFGRKRKGVEVQGPSQA
ncbi:MAG TPA: MFS transporter [Cyclobacteriaceae bacterium]|nr:MFS transporter [Cyclobacteriaceae bacterium]